MHIIEAKINILAKVIGMLEFKVKDVIEELALASLIAIPSDEETEKCVPSLRFCVLCFFNEGREGYIFLYL